MEVTWLVLAELDLNPSFLGLLALVFTREGGEGVGAIVRARWVRSSLVISGRVMVSDTSLDL